MWEMMPESPRMRRMTLGEAITRYMLPKGGKMSVFKNGETLYGTGNKTRIFEEKIAL